MLKVDQYEFIRTGYRVYGKSISELARQTGHSRNTVRRVINQEYTSYSPRTNQPLPVLDQYTEIIDSWLKEDKEQPKKQRHTARRIYNRLRKESGYQGSETSVRRYVRHAKARLGVSEQKAFIPGLPDPGKEAEVDWGNFTAIIAETPTKCKLFCIRPKYSAKFFVRAYYGERQQALFDGHIWGFSFFDGVFRRLIYDNMTPAVQKVLKGKNRVEQESFTRFRSYYTFEAVFCNPGEAHEKGGVESLVGYARRNFLVPVPKVESLEELNEHLLQECIAHNKHVVSGRENTVDKLFEEEKQHLLSLPELPYSNIIVSSGNVDHYSTVIVDKNRYSVPASFAGLKVKVQLKVDRVSIYYENQEIAEHVRAHGISKWILNPDHYLDLLHKRPRAFGTARPIKQWRSHWPESHEHLLCRLKEAQGTTKGTKEFIEVLMLYREYEPETVEKAIAKALAAGVSSGEAIKHLISSFETEQAPERLQNWACFPEADISAYSRLGGVS